MISMQNCSLRFLLKPHWFQFTMGQKLLSLHTCWNHCGFKMNLREQFFWNHCGFKINQSEAATFCLHKWAPFLGDGSNGPPRTCPWFLATKIRPARWQLFISFIMRAGQRHVHCSLLGFWLDGCSGCVRQKGANGRPYVCPLAHTWAAWAIWYLFWPNTSVVSTFSLGFPQNLRR